MEKNEVFRELNDLNSPLAAMPRGMPYAHPEGYFERLADDAVRAAKMTDVPAGYFPGLPQTMLAAAKRADGFEESPLPKTRLIALPIRRWAAAAILLVSISIGGALLFNSPAAAPEEAIASLPPDAVQEYVSIHGYGNEALLDATTDPDATLPELSGLSEDELEAYLAGEGLLF